MITDDNGVIQPHAIEQLTHEALRGWLTRRLNGTDFEVPGGTSQDQGRFLAIEQLLDQLSRAGKDTLQRHLVSILKDFTADSSNWASDSAEELFRIVEVAIAHSDRREDALAALIVAAEDPRHSNEVHLLALQTLIGFRFIGEPVFWREKYRLLGPVAAAVVFEGLGLCHAAAVFEWLRDVDRSPQLESAIRLHMPMLIDDYKVPMIIALTKQFIFEFKPDIREIVCDTLAANGIPVEWMQLTQSSDSVRRIANALVNEPRKRVVRMDKRLLTHA